MRGKVISTILKIYDFLSIPGIQFYLYFNIQFSVPSFRNFSHQVNVVCCNSTQTIVYTQRKEERMAKFNAYGLEVHIPDNVNCKTFMIRNRISAENFTIKILLFMLSPAFSLLSR